jgi:hypothetical protein
MGIKENIKLSSFKIELNKPLRFGMSAKECKHISI